MKVRVEINVAECERYVLQSASKGELKRQSVVEGERYVLESVAANAS